MTANFVDVVSVLLPINSYIGSGMPYLCIFVEEVVALLINRCENLSVVGIRS